MQLHFRQLFILVAAPLLLLWGCHRGIIVEPEVEPVQDNRIIPEHCGIPRVYIETPSEIRSKREWVELSTIRIEAEVEGNTRELYSADSLKHAYEHAGDIRNRIAPQVSERSVKALQEMNLQKHLANMHKGEHQTLANTITQGITRNLLPKIFG